MNEMPWITSCCLIHFDGSKFLFWGKSLLSGDIQNAGRVFQRSHWGLLGVGEPPGGSPMPSSNDSRWPCFYTTEIRQSRVELATSGNPYPTSKSSRAGTGGSFLYWDFSKFPSVWSIVKYYSMPHSSLKDGKMQKENLHKTYISSGKLT